MNLPDATEPRKYHTSLGLVTRLKLVKEGLKDDLTSYEMLISLSWKIEVSISVEIIEKVGVYQYLKSVCSRSYFDGEGVS